MLRGVSNTLTRAGAIPSKMGDLRHLRFLWLLGFKRLPLEILRLGLPLSVYELGGEEKERAGPSVTLLESAQELYHKLTRDLPDIPSEKGGNEGATQRE